MVDADVVSSIGSFQVCSIVFICSRVIVGVVGDLGNCQNFFIFLCERLRNNVDIVLAADNLDVCNFSRNKLRLRWTVT